MRSENAGATMNPMDRYVDRGCPARKVVLQAVLIAVLCLLFLAVPVMAQDGAIRLGIEAVDSDRAYFELTLEPGESADLTVRFTNNGEIATGASVFAADVYTIRGGGMGMADIAAPRTGATEWIDFQDEELELYPGDSVDQTIRVDVPEDAAAGEYITSVVIQNSDPIGIGDDDQRFAQTVRQGIAIAIEVPGESRPEMRIGSANHVVSGSRSVVEVELDNIGNVHLQPFGTFALLEPDGTTIAESSLSLDSVYAGTSTVIEVTFTDLLPSGEYQVSVTMEESEYGASVDADEALSVADQSETEPETDSDDGIVSAITSPERTVVENPGWVALIGAVLVLVGIVVMLAVVVVARTTRQPTIKARPSSEFSFHSASPAAEQTAVVVPPNISRRQIRQLTPMGRQSSTGSDHQR
jgi:hypothetical protein